MPSRKRKQELEFGRTSFSNRIDYLDPATRPVFSAASFKPFNPAQFVRSMYQTPKDEQDLARLFEEAYARFDPDEAFGIGFVKDLNEKIKEAGRNRQTRLVVAETDNYTTGLFSICPCEQKYRSLKRWLKRRGVPNVKYELGHWRFSPWAEKRVLRVVVQFLP